MPLKTVIHCFLFSLIFNPVFADDHTLDEWRVPPGILINIGTHNLHLNCTGRDGPVVVVDSGMGAFSLDWIKVQEMLQHDVMVCAYDRAGYGWSDSGPPPRTTLKIVEELHSLLKQAKLPPPYILVGHSFGGYNMQYFAKSYPELTAGLILIDSSHPEQSSRLPEIPVVRERKLEKVVPIYPNGAFYYLYPEDIRTTLLTLMSSKKSHKAQLMEFRNFVISGKQVSSSGRLPAVPLLVISRGLQDWPDTPLGKSLEHEWQNMQRELADMIPTGKQIIAANAGHLIHLEQPIVVVSAIMSLVNEFREQSNDSLKQKILTRYRNIGG